MRIGLAGPVTLSLLSDYLAGADANVDTYSFPYISFIARNYLESGHSVDIFTNSVTLDRPKVLYGNNLRVYVGRRRESARARGLDLFRIERGDLRSAMKTAGPDVIHAHWTYEFASAALSVQPDALVTAHDSPQALIRHYRHPYWWLRALLGVCTIRRSHNLTAVSPTLQKQIQQWAKSSKTIGLVPNGIQVDEIEIGKTLDRGRPIRFACIANGFDARKNTAIAISAFALVRQTLPEAQLFLFGTGHGIEEAASRWSGQRNLHPGIVFVGAVEHGEILHGLSSYIDILVHTSVWEACSVAILEAQCRGVPVIGGRSSGGVAFTLNGGEAGMLTDIRDEHAVAESMVALATDGVLYAEYSQAGIENVQNNFDFNEVMQTYQTRLKEIFESRT